MTQRRARLLRIVLVVVLAIMVLVSLRTVSPAAAAGDILWTRYDVDISLNEDGTFRVVEDQVIRFDGRYQNGFASIPMGRVEGISDIEVEVGNSEPGLEAAEFVRESRYDGDPGTYTYFRQDGNLEIDYGFEPTEYYGTSTRYVRMSYTVEGGLRSYPDLEPANQQLWWIAISDEVTEIASIEDSTVTLTLPESVAVENLIVDPTDGTIEGNTITWHKSDLGTGDDFEVRAQFPVITSATAPAWQQQDDRLRQEREEQEEREALAGTFLFVAGLLLFVVGGVSISATWYAMGRDPQVGVVADYIAEPPDGLGPGAAGALLDEHAHVRDVIATVVDFVKRGILEITVEEKKDSQANVVTARTTSLRVAQTPTGLKAYEEVLLKAIFPTGATAGVETTLGYVQGTFTAYADTINAAYYQELVDHGYFTQSPEATRKLWNRILKLIPLAGIIVSALIVIVVGGWSWWVIFPIGGSIILSFLSRSLANAMPRKTLAGAEAAAKVEAFKRYLQDIDKREDLEASKEIFEKYIAYAVAFGMEHSWVEKFTSVDTPVPNWWTPVLVPTGGSGGGSMWDTRQQTPRRMYRRSGMPASGDWVFGDRSGKRGGFDLGLPDLQDTSDKAGRGLQAASSGFFDMLSTAAEAMAESSKSSGGSRGGSFGSSGRSGGFSGGGGRSSGGGGGGGSRGFR